MNFRGTNYWAVILGGSSGFGLATAKKLSRHGMNICVVHRDRRTTMERVERDFDDIRETGVQFLAFNENALERESRKMILGKLAEAVRANGGSVRLLMHSIALGNLKRLAPVRHANGTMWREILVERLGVDADELTAAVEKAFEAGTDEFLHLLPRPAIADLLDEDDFANTIHAMGTSLSAWVRDIFEAGLFSPDGRVVSMTSQGNHTAWEGYAAVSAAKASLEALSRSLALEYGPWGIRTNVIQAGVTETPALRMIPGSNRIAAQSRIRNPLRRLTRPEDVADVIALLCLDEAAWINGALICADGGERIAG